MKNNSGKILTVFLAIFAILLVSLAAMSMFFFQKELERRKLVETELEKITQVKTQMETELAAANKKIFVLEEKNKEADEKINSVLEDLELEQGLREEMRLENQQLRASVDAAGADREKLRAELSKEIEQWKSKAAETQKLLDEERNRLAEIEKRMQEQQAGTMEMPAAAADAPQMGDSMETFNTDGMIKSDVELDKIIISSGGKNETGRILTLDADNNFLIFDLGEKDGVSEGDTMAVYRGSNRLGEIKVTRVQPAMSAADFIPPLNGKKVRKSDQILQSK